MGLLRMLLFMSEVCPNCDGLLVNRLGETVSMPRAKLREEVDHYVCERCSVLVNYKVWGWRFPLETAFRPLPGILGLFFRPPRAGRVA